MRDEERIGDGGNKGANRGHKGPETIIMFLIALALTIAITAVVIWFGVTKTEKEEKKLVPVPVYKTGPEVISWKLKMDYKPSEFSNWDGTVTRNNILVARPKSLKDLQNFMKEIKKNTSITSVVPAGGGYSYTDLYASEGQVQVDTSGLRMREDGSEPIKMFKDNGRSYASVLAGVTVGEFADWMVENKLQIPALPTIRNALVAGAVSTGSHGGGLLGGAISDWMTEVTLVDGDGELSTYSESANATEMQYLRCCVGMCGIFYELIFKLETLQDVKVTHYWQPVQDVIKNPEYLDSLIQKGDFLAHFAPLSSLEDHHWSNLRVYNKTRHDYDPWQDDLWIKVSDVLEVEDRRRRSAPEPLPLLYGGVASRMRRSEQPHPLQSHKYAYDYVKGDSGEKNNTVQALPSSMASFEASGQMLIEEVGFIVPDNASFYAAQKWFDIMMDSLKTAMNEKSSMPILTQVCRFMKPSSKCKLCPANLSSERIFTASLTWDSTKPEFKSWFGPVFEKLREAFPEMRVRWAYADAKISGIVEQMQKTVGSEVRQLKEALNNIDVEKFASNFVKRFLA